MNADLENDDAVLAGMHRRDFIRKSAILGGVGSLVWAAPGITSLGSRAFAEHTPINGEGDPDPRHGISFAAIVFEVCLAGQEPGEGELHRAEFDADDGWVAPGNKGGQAAACVPDNWNADGIVSVSDPSQEPFNFDLDDSDDTRWVLRVPFQCGDSGVLTVGVKSGVAGDADGCSDEIDVQIVNGMWEITILGKAKT